MKTLLKEINRRYFRDNPVRFKMKFEGQGLTDNNLYLLGGRAGPIDCISIEYLLHEMCHLAEREKDKLIEKPASSWGFSLGKFWQINNQSGWECSTDQAVLREARVWSYQLSLARALYQEKLSNEERVEFWDALKEDYCRFCGANNPTCQCNNDE